MGELLKTALKVINVENTDGLDINNVYNYNTFAKIKACKNFGKTRKIPHT